MNEKKKHNKKEVLEDVDWHKPEYTEDPDNAPVKFSKPPKRYEAGFLLKLDKRTEIYSLLNTAYQEVMGDRGGADGLSHVQICLIERFVFLEFVLRKIELQIMNEPNKSKLIGRWVQALNSLTGLAKTVGLERRAKKITSLASYVGSKNR